MGENGATPKKMDGMEVVTRGGRKIMLDISEEAISALGFNARHGDKFEIRLKGTVAGVGNKEEGRDPDKKVLWLALSSDNGKVCFHEDLKKEDLELV